jgi:hypothetical protein
MNKITSRIHAGHSDLRVGWNRIDHDSFSGGGEMTG